MCCETRLSRLRFEQPEIPPNRNYPNMGCKTYTSIIMKCNLQSRYGKPHIQEEATHHLFWGGEDGMTKQHRRPKQQRLRLPERASRETTRDKPRRPVWGRKKDKRHFPSSFSLQKHYKKTKKNASSSSSGPVFGASGSSIEAACRSGRTRHLRKAGTEPILSLSP